MIRENFSLRQLLLLLPFSITLGCGNEPGRGVAAKLEYGLEAQSTKVGENLLRIKPGSRNLRFMLRGNGYAASVPKGKRLPIRKKVKLEVHDTGVHQVGVDFFQPDGTLYLSDDLSWEYNPRGLGEPVVSFGRSAINSNRAMVLVSDSRGPSTNEIMFAGDIIEGTREWRRIPPSGKLPVSLTPEDGIKQVRARLRNEFGTPSDWKDLTIAKNTTVPSQCKVQLLTATTSKPVVTAKISAEDDAPLFYKVIGQTPTIRRFASFRRKTIMTIPLSGDPGKKQLTFLIRDEAGNYCDKIDRTVTYDPEAKATSVILDSPLPWTEESAVTANFFYPHFDGEQPEMFVSGQIEDTEKTFEWIPFQSELSLNLEGPRGLKHVLVQYRTAARGHSKRVHTSVYLNPFIEVLGKSSPYQLLLSRIPGTKVVSITGCEEPYDEVPLQKKLTCHAQQPEITVDYYHRSGETVARSASVP